MSDVSRRDFIKVSTQALFYLSGLLGLSGLARYFSYIPEPEKPTEFDLGDAANFPRGSRALRGDIPAVIYNRDGKIFAYSLVCTHLGCAVTAEDGGFACPCHGSRFDENGAVLEGPAREQLHPLRVEVLEDNHVKLYLG